MGLRTASEELDCAIVRSNNTDNNIKQRKRRTGEAIGDSQRLINPVQPGRAGELGSQSHPLKGVPISSSERGSNLIR
ncbi:hypothetical protein RRG08_051216 [Elysia crispata]|uniref:Uncharacterized protein n=1 Tax=Elysia crispata TaxID=231223 RepID=A0AAE0Z282_9GAST|nr:hypothetical protein RRG08_051216 [Elysia crispata]